MSNVMKKTMHTALWA